MTDKDSQLPVKQQSKSESGNPMLRDQKVSFDFVAANQLERCVSRLAGLQDLRDLDPWSPKTRVNINQLDDSTYAFTIRETEPAPVELQGYMNRLDDHSTYISGEAIARVYLQAAEMGVILVLIIGLTIFVGFFVAVLFLPPLGVFTWYYWRGALKERDRLVAVVKDTLSYM